MREKLRRKGIWEYRLVFIGTIALLIALLIYVWTPSLIDSADSAKTQKGQDPLVTAFTSVGAQAEELRLVSWSLYDERFIGVQDLAGVAQALSKKLGLADTKEGFENESDWHSYSVQGKTGGITYQIVLQSLPNETYLLVSCGSNQSIETFVPLRDNLLEMVSVNNKAEVNCLLIGSIEGELTPSEMEKRIKAAFADSGAVLVEQAGESNYFSATGYIDGLDQVTMTGANKANIQIACNYNEKDKKTFVYLGYPLIFEDY